MLTNVLLCLVSGVKGTTQEVRSSWPQDVERKHRLLPLKVYRFTLMLLSMRPSSTRPPPPCPPPSNGDVFHFIFLAPVNSLIRRSIICLPNLPPQCRNIQTDEKIAPREGGFHICTFQDGNTRPHHLQPPVKRAECIPHPGQIPPIIRSSKSDITTTRNTEIDPQRGRINHDEGPAINTCFISRAKVGPYTRGNITDCSAGICEEIPPYTGAD